MTLECVDRKDQILLFAAGALDDGECGELRDHLAGGCPACAGALAEAQAVLAQLPLALDAQPASPRVRQKILDKVRAAPGGNPIPIGRDWDRAIISSSIAAMLAVGVTLLCVRHFTHAPTDTRDAEIAMLRDQLQKSVRDVSDMRRLLDETRAGLSGLKFASLTGSAQPQALGRAFIDMQGGKWYFFTTGMTPPASGKTYELWLISDDKKIPAGTFDVNSAGSATLSGVVPALRAGAAVTLAVTDEPAGGVDAPTGHPQIVGPVQFQ